MAYTTALETLADPTRRAVFERLREGPLSVAQIAGGLPVSRPAVSQHLKVLKDAGLVRDEPRGTARIYRIHAEGLRELRDWLDGFWDEALTRFKDYAEGEDKQ
jgi:DNA-binding transcriptional ArsR family regulator